MRKIINHVKTIKEGHFRINQLKKDLKDIEDRINF